MSDEGYCPKCDGEFPSLAKHVRLAHPAPGIFRWRQRRWWAWLSKWMYVVGITSSGVHSGTGNGWIVRNFYRGKRPYIFGIKRERWGDPWHRVRQGHWPEPVFGFCGICAPWPCCGASGVKHAEDCPGD